MAAPGAGRPTDVPPDTRLPRPGRVRLNPPLACAAYRPPKENADLREECAVLRRATTALAVICLALTSTPIASVLAQDGPELLVSDLAVRTVTTGLATPTSLAFIGPNDFLVLEKNTGQVKRVVNGAVTATVLDLAVNFGSERGVLGIALHP